MPQQHFENSRILSWNFIGKQNLMFINSCRHNQIYILVWPSPCGSQWW